MNKLNKKFVDAYKQKNLKVEKPEMVVKEMSAHNQEIVDRDHKFIDIIFFFFCNSAGGFGGGLSGSASNAGLTR